MRQPESPDPEPTALPASVRGELIASLSASAQRIARGASDAGAHEGLDGLQAPVPYDRRAAAWELLRKFVEAGRLGEAARVTVLEHRHALEQHLPENVEDLDGNDVLEWLERQLPVRWSDDTLAVPEAQKATLTTLIESILSRAEADAVPQDVAEGLAAAVAEAFPVAPAAERQDVQRRLAHGLVELLASSPWQDDAARAELAIRALARVAELLHVRWTPSARSERAYSPDAQFIAGDVLIHAKFGRGVVISRTDTTIEVQFAEGMRRLGVSKPPRG